MAGASSIWDLCSLDLEQSMILNNLSRGNTASSSSSSSACGNGISPSNFNQSAGRDDVDISSKNTHANSAEYGENNDDIDLLSGCSNKSKAQGTVDHLQISLEAAESSCKSFMAELDGILYSLGEVNVEFNDVTGRTNNLMLNCESLLEQHHDLELTVGKLRTNLKPFEEVEACARLLGMPLALGNSTQGGGGGTSKHASTGAGTNIDGTQPQLQVRAIVDPRSSEFKDVLQRLSKAQHFFEQHKHDYLDAAKYHHWTVQLHARATSLVAKAMRTVLESTVKLAIAEAQTQTQGGNWNKNNSGNGPPGQGYSTSTNMSKSGSTNSMAILATKMLIDDTPIEGASLYRKFRGLGYRLKDLAALLTAHAKAQAQFDVIHAKEYTPQKNSTSGTGIAKTGMSSSVDSTSADSAAAAMDEVKLAYVGMRQQLLMPFIEALSISTSVSVSVSSSSSSFSSPASNDSTHTSGGSSAKARSLLMLPGRTSYLTLCPAIHHAFMMLLRVCQLEHQLFQSLFVGGGTVEDASAEESTAATPVKSNTTTSISSSVPVPGTAFFANSSSNPLSASYPQEVIAIISSICNCICDGLRPLVIRESNVDELCRVAGTLAEDIRSQIANVQVPLVLRHLLEQAMSRTVCDTQERLSYCAEMQLRHEVMLFKPMPAHLAYPSILEAAAAAVLATAVGTDSTSMQSTSKDNNTDTADIIISRTWYPPLKHIISLLSKLYGVVDSEIFEDFARRAVRQCVQILRQASETIARNGNGSSRGSSSNTSSVTSNGSGALHGDLFLVRHLLILREQLSPFDARLQGTEKHLDFSTTGTALSNFASWGNASTGLRNSLRFDRLNSLWQLAKEGLPGLQEDSVDAKLEMDTVLKVSCTSFKASSTRLLLGSLDGWLAKITACIGDVPIAHDNSSSSNANINTTGGINMPPPLPADQVALLKKQAFLRTDRIKEILLETHTNMQAAIPTLRKTMRLYIDNSVARTILLKPILLEVETVRRKVDTVLACCVDAGPARSGLELLIGTISDTVSSELL